MSRWAWMAGQAAAILLVQYALFMDPSPNKPSPGIALVISVIFVAFFTALLTNLGDWTKRTWRQRGAAPRGAWLAIEAVLLACVYRFVLPGPPAGPATHVFLMAFWTVVLTFAMAGLFALWDRLARMMRGRSQAGRVDAALPQPLDHSIARRAAFNRSASR